MINLKSTFCTFLQFALLENDLIIELYLF